MSVQIMKISTLHQLHEMMNLEKPKHPLLSIIDASVLSVPEERVGLKILQNLYMISLKDKDCGVDYGRNSFDFEEGVMVFSAPGQVYTTNKAVETGEIKGWVLFFHPDLIRNTPLEQHMDDYSFFDYDVYEALHLSEDEEKKVWDCVENIRSEYESRIDNHSQRVMVSNLELLLNYSLRFYERQFNTRANQSKDIVVQFQRALKAYFKEGRQTLEGLPSIQYFAEKVHLSQHYFSDLLKKETGRTAKDHINDFIVEKAKSLLLSSQESISGIAYDLGFNYPHYFTRLFKSKTGQTPVQFRNLN